MMNRTLFLTRCAFALSIAISCVACRKPTPDEIVYTGKGVPPKPPPAGAGGGSNTTTGGTGGTTDGRGGRAGAGGTGADPTTPFSKAALLGAIADCAIDRYGQFLEVATHLEDKARSAAASHAPPDMSAVKQAWLTAMTKWEEVELFRFGPLARSTEPGGKDLRDHIYAWPLINRCNIEERLVDRTYGEADLAAALINVRGLGALEYLSFYEGTDNACSEWSAINAHGTWARLGAADIAERKASYAASVANDVLGHAKKLVELWAPHRGNFRAELVQAGTHSATFASEQKALNAVSDALFYIEQEVKDWKLGRPLGLGDCATLSCPDEVESPYARRSAAHLRANLAGFRALYQGCEPGYGGFGFDDWLRAVGAVDIADRMLAAVLGAEDALEALDTPLEQVMVNDPPRAMVVYTAFKALTDLLKAEFVTALNLELPKSTQGDND